MSFDAAIRSLFDKKNITYRIRNGELVPTYCPFCNGGDNRDEQTFAVNLHNGAYNCRRGSCSEKGTARQLFDFFGETAPDDYGSFVNTAKKVKLYERPDINAFSAITDECVAYLAKRGIGEETIHDMGLLSDDKGNIVFPFFKDGVLTYVKYRQPRKYEKGNKVPKEWQMSNTQPILWNMDNCSFNKPLYITEGQIDAMSLYEAGVKNVVSVPCGCDNMEWIDVCWDWLEKFSQIILFGDNDDPGIRMINTLQKRLGEDRCLKPSSYPELIYMGVDKGRLCKDANEILVAYGKEKLEEFALSVEPAPIRGVINLADVEFVDPSTVKRIYTRIPKLDQCIGGLSEGQLVVFSGKRGEGKSTLNGQIGLNAIEQGERVCAYSGELSAQNFLNWIMCQATERRLMSYNTSLQTGKKFAFVPSEVQARIKRWLDGKFWLFDNSYIEPKKQADTVLGVFEICARRHGCKIFIVDNLMSILCDADEENKAQAQFAARLKSFAVKYRATVLLVAHPRKQKQGEKFTNDDVSGSSA